MPGAAGESSAGGAGSGSLACSQNQPLGPHLGTHVLTVSYDEQLCIFHSDDPEVVPPGCGEREPIDEGTITLSVFKPRDLSWQTWALLDGSGVTIGPEGTTNPEWWPGPLTTDGVNRMPTVRFAVSLSDGVCSSKPIAAEDGGEAQVDFHWPTGRVTDFVRRCRDEFRTLYYEYRVTGSGAEGCDLAACNDLVNNAPPAEVNRTRPTVPYGQAVPLAGGDGQVAGGTYHLKAVDYPSDPPATPLKRNAPARSRKRSS